MAHIERDYDGMYAADVPPPWEIGAPQPALAALLDRVEIESPVLDVGCGTGELATYAAQRGHQVLGIDGSAEGVAQARAKAADKGVDVAFRVADATRLEELDIRPRSVLDSGLLHCLDDEGQKAYVAGLEAVCGSGALVCVLAMSAEAGVGWGETPEKLTRLFSAPAWVATTVEPTEILAGIDGAEHHLASYLMTARRA